MKIAYHPQANGHSEQFSQTLEPALLTLLASPIVDKEWDDLVAEITYALNNFKNQFTGQTPFALQCRIGSRSILDIQLLQ